jgi:hypothetical protein
MGGWQVLLAWPETTDDFALEHRPDLDPNGAGQNVCILGTLGDEFSLVLKGRLVAFKQRRLDNGLGDH